LCGGYCICPTEEPGTCGLQTLSQELNTCLFDLTSTTNTQSLDSFANNFVTNCWLPESVIPCVVEKGNCNADDLAAAGFVVSEICQGCNALDMYSQCGSLQDVYANVDENASDSDHIVQICESSTAFASCLESFGCSDFNPFTDLDFCANAGGGTVAPGETCGFTETSTVLGLVDTQVEAGNEGCITFNDSQDLNDLCGCLTSFDSSQLQNIACRFENDVFTIQEHWTICDQGIDVTYPADTTFSPIICEPTVCGCPPGYDTVEESDGNGCVTSCLCVPQSGDSNVICPDGSLAECCDGDGSCSDGDDDYCCSGEFYCSNDGAEYAEANGGILCPSTSGECDACVSDIVSSDLCRCFSDGSDCDESLIPASCTSAIDASCFGLAAVTCTSSNTEDPSNTQEPSQCDACVSSIISSNLCYCLDNDAECDESLIPAECRAIDDSCFFYASVQCNNSGTPESTEPETGCDSSADEEEYIHCLRSRISDLGDQLAIVRSDLDRAQSSCEEVHSGIAAALNNCDA